MIPLYEKLYISPGDVVEIKLGDMVTKFLVKTVTRWVLNEQTIDLSANVTESVSPTYEGKKIFAIKKEDGIVRICRVGIEPSYLRIGLVLNNESIAKLKGYTAGGVKKDYGFIWGADTPRYKPKLTLPVPPGYEWAFDVQTPFSTDKMIMDIEIIDLEYEETLREPTLKIQMLPIYVSPTGETLTWGREE